MRALEERRGEQGQMSQRGQGEWSIEENVLGPCKKGSSRRHFLPASGNSGYVSPSTYLLITVVSLHS